MSGFDTAVLSFFNQFAQRWPAFDELVVLVSDSDLIKGGIILAAIWGAWFARSDPAHERDRRLLLAAVIGSLVALLIARVLAGALPLRTRPVLSHVLHFTAPSGLPQQTNWTRWSCFPSDHAALFFALAVGLFCIKRWWGVVAGIYILIAVCLPRLYVGAHYPSDILGGAALGIFIVAVLSIESLNRIWTRPLVRWQERHPATFYFVAFLLTYQIASLFWDVRMLLDQFGLRA